jgi:CRP/FNR family transcriptional regulator, polysaccharide utilization system transcription regulator
MAILKSTHNCLNCIYKHPLFTRLSNEELQMINDAKLEVTFNEGENMLKQGSFVTHIISVTSGLAKVYIEGISKRNLILQYVKPGDFIGGPGAFVDKINHFSVVAVEDTNACLIPIDVFKQIIQTNHTFALGYIEDISLKGIFNFDRFISLTQKQMYGRVADALLYQYKNIYSSRTNGFPLNRKDLADFTALSKDSAGRILNSFEESGFIKISDNKIIILNLEQLEDISSKG